MPTPAYLDALGSTGAATLQALAAFEHTIRHLDPPAIRTLREALAPRAEALDAALVVFAAIAPPADLAPFHAQFLEGATRAQTTLRTFLEDAPPAEVIPRVLASMRTFARSLEALYPLHHFPPIGRFFVEPAFHEASDLDPDPPEGAHVGMHRTTRSDEHGDRGGFCLYVPERYDGSEAWPLVVALHGGSGSGRDFVWTWLREARGRRFLLLAPTAQDSTWSLMEPEVDGAMLHAMVAHVAERWRVDEARVLLTGLSDGATFSLLAATLPDSPFTAFAPVSGVVPPDVVAGTRGKRLAGRPVYLVHGTRDWMFPVEFARAGRDALASVGADVRFREIEDLSHTYPREENDRILTWFDPRLALPQTG